MQRKQPRQQGHDRFLKVTRTKERLKVTLGGDQDHRVSDKGWQCSRRVKQWQENLNRVWSPTSWYIQFWKEREKKRTVDHLSPNSIFSLPSKYNSAFWNSTMQFGSIVPCVWHSAWKTFSCCWCCHWNTVFTNFAIFFYRNFSDITRTGRNWSKVSTSRTRSNRSTIRRKSAKKDFMNTAMRRKTLKATSLYSTHTKTLNYILLVYCIVMSRHWLVKFVVHCFSILAFCVSHYSFVA